MSTITSWENALKVCPVVFGTWHFGGAWGTVDLAEAKALMRYANERGVTIFDTARAYGEGAAERLLGEALRDALAHRRDEVVIATKGGLRLTAEGRVRDASAGALREDVDASLRALGIDEIDLYQLHWPDPRTSIDETAGALKELLEVGKVRQVGVSNFDVAQIDRFSRTLPVETVQSPYHLFRREIEAELLPYARAHGIGVLVYGPLAHGLLTGNFDERSTFADEDWRAHSPAFQGGGFRRNIGVARILEQLARAEMGCSLPQLALAWTLRHPNVHAAILGLQRRQHIDDALTAAEMTLDPALCAEIERVAAAAVPVATQPVFAR